MRLADARWLDSKLVSDLSVLAEDLSAPLAQRREASRILLAYEDGALSRREFHEQGLLVTDAGEEFWPDI